MFDTIEVVVDENIGRIWLNNPQKLNPLSTQALTELVEAARWFNTQHAVKVVVIGGRGRAFSAGADLMSFAQALAQNPRAAADAGRQMAEAVEAMQAVTIARLQGWCVGGGLVLASACDLRVASEDARFSIPEVDLGIPLAWGGIPRLVREIGPALTKELVLTCRPFDAAEAKAAGFLNRVVSAENLDTTIAQLTSSLATKASLPLIATKQHVNAVTAQMVGTGRSWSDAESLLAAFADPECQAARQTYIMKQQKKSD